MAELDDKLLKNLDKTLESMNERLITLETTLSGVKNGLNKTFDPSIITSFSDALRGIKTLRLIDAEKASQDINKVKETLAKLQDAYQKWEGGELALSPKALSNLTDLLAKYKELNKNIDKGSEQRSVELANAAKKEADAVEAEERRKQKAFQDSVKQQTELARKYAELEKLRSDVFGGRSYGKLSGKGKVQWTEMGSSLEKIKKQMEEIEKLSPGSRAKGESIYKEQEAITRAKRESAEEQKRIAKEEAEYEKLLRQEQIQEERRKAAETKRLAKEEADALSEYIRLYREKTGLLKTVSPLDAKIIRNQPLTEQERGLYDASWKRIYAIQDQMAKLRESYVSVLEYEEKIQANGQEQVALGKVRLTQEQALAKEKERQAKSESKQQSDEAKIQKQADAIVKKRIDIERQVQRIDNDRAIRQQTNSKISQQALDAESRKYEALLQRINQLNNALAKLEGKQAGVTSRAEQQNAPYMNYVAAAEEERKAKAIENSTKKLKEQKSTLKSMLPTLQRLASAFGVAFSVRGLAQFGKKLIETRGEFEMQFVAMKQIIGDVDAATKIWNQTMQQALQSPFKAMQLVTYTKQLAAYRIETEKLFDTTKRLADISAGLGVDMGRLILAFGQVKSANFLRASEIRQFTEAGVNIVGNLAQYFSELEGRAVSTAEVMERVTKRMVSFADVEEIFKRMTDEGGEFYKMQEVQADTVKGQINKLHDAYDQMLNTIGQANQGTIRKFVEILNNMVRNWRDIVPLIKSSVAILGTYVAVTKLARMGTQKYGDAIVRLRLGKKKQTVEMEAALVKETLLLNRQAKTITAWQYQTQKAIFNVKMAWKALGGIFKSFAPFLAIEGALYTFNKIMEPIREARRLTEDLANIRVENKSRADEEVNNYDKLIHRFNELNRGSIERKEIIDKLNSQYGKYIGFQVSETTTLNDLAEAQERVNLNIREKARLRAEEEAQQRIAENYMRRESKLLNPTQAWGIKDVYTFLYNDASTLSGQNTMWLANVEKFAEYAQTKIHDLTDEELKSRQELVNATGEWLNTFYGVSGATKISKGLVDLVELYAEQEQKLRDERKQISEDLKGLPLQVQEDILAMQSQVATAMQKLTKAEAGEKVEIPLLDNMRIVVPPDLAEKSGVWEVIKQEINKRQEDFKIKLKLDAGAITEDQAEELRKQAKTTGDIFVDAVNKEISEGILKDAGIEGTFDELKKQIIDYPEMISDWDKVNDAIELINSNLITASDITNGLTNYTKILSENLGNGREAIDEAVKRQNLLVDGTEEEVKKAQEAVDKAKERYKWLLKIAKLLGLDTKSADEIVEEEGYDLSVGQFRLAAAQSAFMEKFGKASNAYGKQLSQIGVTENLKEVADAYHKQSDELDGLIKNQEKALENETNLTEEQKENAKTTIENLKEQKSMAEFLAEFFGYVPKKTTTRTTHENASKLISLIKEMRSEYDKLSKSAYGYAKSEEKVREAYRDSVKAILEKAGVTEDYDFTTNEGMIAALNKVLAYANKLGPEAAAEVQKYIDQLETEIEINAQVRIREDFAKEMEKMFNNYELTIDLEKFSLPADELAGIFDFDLTTIDELRKRVNDFYEEQKALGKDPEDLVKQVDELNKKIDDMDRKALLERLKKYTEYLKKGRDEAVQIHLDELKAMAEVDELYKKGRFTDEQYRDITKGIRNETNEKLAKQTWKDFKESDYYTTMFEDLDHVATSSIDLMINRLKGLQNSMSDLDPTQVKEIVQSIDKLEQQKRQRSPFRSFIDDFKTMNQWFKRSDEYENMIGFLSKGEEDLAKQKEEKVKEVAQLEHEYNQLALDGEEENAQATKDRWDVARAELAALNESLKEYNKNLGKITKKNDEGFAAMRRVLQGVAQGAQYFSDMASVAGTIATEMMDMFDGVDDASKKLAKDIADIATNTAMLAADIVKAIASEGTDVGSMIDGLVRTWNIIKGALSASEKEINSIIESNTDKIQRLEWELDRLRRVRDRAWDTATIVQNEKEIEKAIYDQIKAYNALISAEEDRKSKNQDQITQWKQEREELRELLQDEQEEFAKTFGGIGEGGYRDAAQGFVDAWKQAFLETGDGLSGLEDHFNEFLQEWFVKQATLRIAGKMLEPLFRDIDAAVDKYGVGGTDVLMSELKNIWDRAGVILPDLADKLEGMADWWGLEGEGGLSGLAAGIQGMTEEQANILEAYWNSVRGYTASIDMNVATIVGLLSNGSGIGGGEGKGNIFGDQNVNTNPMLQQLSLIAANTQATHQLLQSVTKSGHPQGGYGIKVFAD